MRVTVLHVLFPTADIDISLVTVGQRAVEFTLFGPPVAGLLGDLCSSFNSFSYSSFSSFNYSSFISFSFNFTFWTEGEWLSLRCLYISFSLWNILPQFSLAHWTVCDLLPIAFAIKSPPSVNLSLVVGLCNQLSWSHLVLSPWLSKSALSCLTQSFCQTLAPSSSSFKLSAPMFLKEAYSCTLLLQSWWATGVVLTFSFSPFSFISFLVSSLRHIVSARCITASNLPRSVHLITRVSKPYSRTGFRKVSMRRPLFLIVNLFDTRAGLSRSFEKSKFEFVSWSADQAPASGLISVSCSLLILAFKSPNIRVWNPTLRLGMPSFITLKRSA